MLSYFLYWFAEFMNPAYTLLNAFLGCACIALVIGVVRKLFFRGEL